MAQDYPTEVTHPKNTLTTSEAALYLGLKKSTLEQWRWRGCGPCFVKLNRSVRYRVSDLDLWMDERVMESTANVGGSAHE